MRWTDYLNVDESTPSRSCGVLVELNEGQTEDHRRCAEG